MPRGESPNSRKNLEKGNRYTSSNQPTGKAKSEGIKKAIIKKRVLQLAGEQFFREKVMMKTPDGKVKKINTFQACIKKYMQACMEDPELFHKFLSMIGNFEHQQEVLEFNNKREAYKYGEEEEADTEHNFIDALNASVEDVWQDEAD